MADPKPQFSHFANKLLVAHPDLAYLHAIESEEPSVEESNDFLREIWGTKPYLAAGGFTRDTAIETVEQKGGLVVFGRHFISNVRFSLFVPTFARADDLAHLCTA